MSEPCAICDYFGMPPRRTRSVLTVATEHPQLAGRTGNHAGVTLPVCPEHAVDVYRGRVPGVRMAWQLVHEPRSAARTP